MATESIISLRGFAKIALALLFSVCLCQGAWAGTTSSVVVTGPVSAVASHPATWGSVWQTAISSKGDVVVGDFENGALYEFPAGGGAMITLAAPGAWASGGWSDIGVTIDPWDNLWIDQNWNNELERIPYDPVNHTWNMSDPNIITYGYSWTGNSQAFNTVNASIPWFQPAAISFSPAASSGTATMVVCAANASALYEFTVDSGGNVSSGSVVISSLSKRARSLAVDTAGNIYMYEDGGVSGIVEVPAGVTGLADDKSLTRVDPSLANPDGVTVDLSGNVYVSDSAAGVYFVPNESGTLNPSDAVLMAAVPADANVDFDLVRGIMYVPTTSGSKGGWNGINDLAAVALSNLNLGNSAAGVQGSVETINVAFDASTTLSSIEIVEAGVSTDFTIVGGTCKIDTAYAAGSTCTVEVALKAQAVGDLSAKLELLDASSNVLASFNLSGRGLVPAIASGPPTAVASHPATWGKVWESAISSHGDLVVGDFEQGALYEFPAGGGALITLAAPGAWGSGGWSDIGVAIDPWDNLWVDDNWNAELIRVPYKNGTWNMSDPNAITYQYSWNPGGQAFNTAFGNWFQAAAIGIGPKNANGTATIVVSAANSGTLYSGLIDASGNVTNGATVIKSLKARAKSIAIDYAGNIYLTEDGGVSGVVEVPAGATNLADDKSLTRVDPNLANPGGVAVDAAGNVYVGDSSDGVYLVPNENGTPNPNDAYLLAPVPAYANVNFDLLRGIMYIPTTQGENGGWNGINDVAAVAMSSVNFGSIAAGSAGTATTVSFGLSAGATPAKAAIVEAGSTALDFVLSSSGNCVTGAAFAALSTCSESVELSPKTAGAVSGKLVLLDASNNVLGSMDLAGIGIGSAIAVTPAQEYAIGNSLNLPNQVAVDALGNTYVANPGAGNVLMYPVGSNGTTAGVSVGSGLISPTGVVADGAGDLFVGDSGKVIEIPYAPGGLNTAGQTTLTSGLGSNLNLAVDVFGNLFVADPANAQVLELPNAGGWFGEANQAMHIINGFSAPSAVAVDASGNLYVVDGANLIEVTPDGTKTTLLSSLSGANGLAVDASGAVYISSTSGTVRIPLESGTLNTGDQTAIATSVTSPKSLALDKNGNVYLADGTANSLHVVSINGVVSTGSPALGSVGTATADVLNIGNAPLTVTGFSSSDSEDFSATGCASAVSPNTSCAVDVTMNPGAGIQGPISSVITINGNESNPPVVLDASGVAPALAASSTTISVANSANVLSVPITVTVTAASGAAVPTGNAVISVDGVALPAATLVSGTVTVTVTTGITAGSHTFSVQYIGDRVYGSSTATITATVAKGTVTLVLPAPPAYSISSADGYTPYNADVYLPAYYTNYLTTVAGAANVVPTGYVYFMQGTSPALDCFASSDTSVGAPPIGSHLLGSNKNHKGIANAPGTTTFDPGCLSITANSNVPNVVTPQLINSVVYAGDDNYQTATATTTSAGQPILFEELRNPSVAISPNPGTVTVSNGTGSATLSVTSVLGYGAVSTNSAYPLAGTGSTRNNYTLPIGFACQGLPARATCTFSGGNYTDANGVLHTDELSINTDPSVVQNIQVTVTTNVSAGTTTSQNSRPAPFEFAALFGVGLVGLVFGRKSGRNARILMMLCLVILSGALFGITACSTTTLGTTPVLTTPSGSYSVTVTAQQVGSVVVQTSNGPVNVYGSQNQMSLPYTMTVTVQ
jgi:sugar lactone lactonase YvrE